MRFRILLAALFAMAALSVQAAIPTSEQTQVVEFYNQSLDHYFITTTAQEISDLDTGVHPGWVRTGYQFPAIWGGNSYPNTSPVCRFYGRPEAHLDSHFYSAKPSECDDVKNKFSSTWQYESPEVFRGFLVDPASGLCPVDTVPVYRLWNQRPDVNHRYTDQLSVYFYMVAKGYKPEGDGSPAFPVVFCTPAGGSVVPAPSAGAPDCTASASSATPVVGSTLSLNAQCTNNPTSFTWTGCTSSTSSCQVTQSAAGAAGYTVYASNAQGPATPVVRNVIWSTGAGAVPICAISTNTLTPTVGTPLALTVSCSQTPTRYDWMACDYAAPTNCTIMPACSTTSTSCSLVSGTPGFAHYAVSAANTAGTGARAGVDVEWKSSTGGGPPDPVPSCSILSTNTTPAINTAIVLIASCTGNPTSYAWTGLTCSASQCSTSSATVGTRTYSVIARNATGPSNVASTNVDWKASAPPPVPSCTLSASNTTPSPGQTITITSSCTNSPTSYAWTGCSSSGASCTDSVTTAGFKDYSVVAANGGGSGSQATVTVEWKVANTSPPVCTIATSNLTPTVGQNLTMSANCSGSPTSYAWTNCASTSAACVATASATGAQTYSVSGANANGPGAAASVTVNWQPVGTVGPGFCPSYSNVLQSATSWGDIGRILTTSLGGFQANGVVAISFVAPSSAGSYLVAGSTSMAEFGEPATTRQMTLSKTACDFRPVDPTGASGPYRESDGNTVIIDWNVGAAPVALVPGQTYYVNFRNWSVDLNNGAGGVSCFTSTCNASIQFNWPAQPVAAPTVPNCSLSASSLTPQIGQSITVTSSCTNNPTSYAWTGCTSSGSTCTDTVNAAGFKSYSMIATNGVGAGNPASVTVEWKAPVTTPPVCSVSASNLTPTVGQNVTLTSSCSGSPTSYTWTNCTSSSATCVATAAAAGSRTYSVSGSNNNGVGNAAPITVNWQPVGTVGPGFCPSYSNVVQSATSWGDIGRILTSSIGGFQANGVVVISFVAPASASSYLLAGNTTLAEYGEPATTRQMTLSNTACDFRPADPSGANGPYRVTNGNTVTIDWNVGALPVSLVPGQTYYFSFRNWSVDLNGGAGGVSCFGSTCNASIQFNWPGQPVAAPTVPNCSLSSSNLTPQIGQSITVTSSCTNNPTSYAWTGCTSSGPTCTDTVNAAGPKNYSLIASNALGGGNQSTVTVQWKAPSTTPPVCTVAASNPAPTVGQNVTLTSSCSGSPTSYTWTNCTSTSATCVATASTAGTQSYSVAGTNGFGPGAAASTSVSWQPVGGGGGTNFCGAYNNVVRTSTTWGDIARIRTTSLGGFQADGVIVISFVAPASPGTYSIAGNTSMAEFGEPATTRQMTLSSSACDFRDTDTSGTNGPYAASNGNTVIIDWNVGGPPVALVPGQTYYFNFRNWSVDLNGGAGAISCFGSTCNASIQFNWPS